MPEIRASKAVSLRLKMATEKIDAVADVLVKGLEAAGFEVIEWSRPYPCREPETDQSRIYLTAVAKELKGELDENA